MMVANTLSFASFVPLLPESGVYKIVESTFGIITSYTQSTNTPHTQKQSNECNEREDFDFDVKRI